MKIFKEHNYFLPNIKFSVGQLFVLTSISFILLFIVNFNTSKVRRTEYPEMKNASEKMIEASKQLRNLRNNLGLNTDRNIDPLQSGFIGVEFSPITTTLGDLEAKKLSTNPDFSALFLLWFNKLNLQKKDTIIIHLSGSFPALGIAAIIASESYGLEPIIFSSIGASSFGANHPELTYWDIENFLYEERMIHHKTIYPSLGGQNDNGSSFWEDGLEIANEAAIKYGLNLNSFNTLEDAINYKMGIIKNVNFSLFLNIGGNHSAVGNSTTNIFFNNGLITENVLENFDNKSLINQIGKMDIPIIHVLGIKEIALENGIDLIFNESFIVGKSDLYFIKTKSRTTIALALILLFGAIIFIKLRSINQPTKSHLDLK